MAPAYQFTFSGVTDKAGFCGGCCANINGTWTVTFRNPGQFQNCDWEYITNPAGAPIPPSPNQYCCDRINQAHIVWTFSGGVFAGVGSSELRLGVPTTTASQIYVGGWNPLAPTVLNLVTTGVGGPYTDCNLPSTVTVVPLGTPFNLCTCGSGSGSGSSGETGMMAPTPDLRTARQTVPLSVICPYEGIVVESAPCNCDDKHVRICHHPEADFDRCTSGYVRGSPYPSCLECRGDPRSLGDKYRDA